MDEKTKVFQFSIQPSLVDRVKGMGNGKFPAGLYFLLREYDRLQGSTTKLESAVFDGKKPASRNTYEADPRVPMLPGETPPANKRRLAEYINNLPETRRAKYRPQIERYLKECYSQYGGIVDEDTEYTPYELSKDGMTPIYGTPIRIMDYITEDERDAWVEAGRIHALGDKERNTVHYRNDEYHPKTAVTRTKQLSADSKYMYQNYPNLMAGLTDAQIETMNDECDGAIERGVDPIDPPTENN